MKALSTAPSHEAIVNGEFKIEDNFTNYSSGQRWTTVATDSGTAAAVDTVGGALSITPSDGTVADNDEIYIKATNESFIFGVNYPFTVRAKCTFTEANTDDANVFVGVMNAIAANSLLDDGGGPPANSNHAVFFKVDGGTKWQFETSVGTTQTTTTISDVTTAGDGTYRVLGIDCFPISTTRVEVIPTIDGVQCKDTNGNLIKHTVDATSGTTEMQLGWGMKNGAVTNVETFYMKKITARGLE